MLRDNGGVADAKAGIGNSSDESYEWGREQLVLLLPGAYPRENRKADRRTNGAESSPQVQSFSRGNRFGPDGILILHATNSSLCSSAKVEFQENVATRASAGCRQLEGERVREGQDSARACPPAGRVAFAIGVLYGLVL